jgi:choline dehydrogenase-like flavoprotein
MGTPGIVASLLPFVGEQAKQMMTLYPRLAASLLLAPDEPSGRVELTGAGRPLIRYDHRDEHKARLRAAAKAGARAYLAAGAEQVVVPVVPPVVVKSEADLAKIDAITLRPASAPLLSAHQQGTVRFAPSEKDGAADPNGQVYGTKGIFVFDSSGFPTSASSHTMAPIITVARFLTTRLLAEA